MDKIKIIRCNVSDDNKALFIFSGVENYDGDILLAEKLMKKLTNNYKRHCNPDQSFDFRSEKISMHNAGPHNYYDIETDLWILYEDIDECIPIIKDFIKTENSTNLIRTRSINLLINAFGSKIIKGNFKR